MVDLERSASQTTTSGLARPSSTRALPNASRVATPIFSSNLVLVAILLQLLEGEFHFVGRGRDAVEFRIIFHEGDALALDGIGHDGRGFSLGGGRFREGSLERRK